MISAADDYCDFTETAVLSGLRMNQFRHLSDDDKTLLVRLISMCCEQSFRRGFQQGHDSRGRGDKVCDLEQWRFCTSLAVSPSPHDTYHTTSLDRLKIECPLHFVGLPRMEEVFLTSADIKQWLAPLFPRFRRGRSAGLAKSVRFKVLHRDGFRCVYCGASAREKKLHIDHIHPQSKGGGNEMSNLVTACDECNLGKSDKTGVVFEREAKDGPQSE